MPRREFSRRQRRYIWSKSKGKCAECGEPVRYRGGSSQMDHKRPQWGGGANTTQNGQVLCTDCHKEKTSTEAAMREKADRTKAKHEGRWVSAHRPIDGSRRSRWGQTFDGRTYRR